MRIVTDDGIGLEADRRGSEAVAAFLVEPVVPS
jgi:hypothetical protein